jgi:hypothetical protein
VVGDMKYIAETYVDLVDSLYIGARCCECQHIKLYHGDTKLEVAEDLFDKGWKLIGRTDIICPRCSGGKD